MTHSALKNSPRGHGRSGLRRRRKTFRSSLERLEERCMLDGAAPATAIVVGRTLSSYTSADVTDGTLSITYTAYNEQAEPVDGVLLVTALQPGVTFAGATAAPDRNGQDLAWSLGTVAGFERVSVTLTVSLASPIP